MKTSCAAWAGVALAVPALLACGTPTRPAESVSKAELAVHQADAPEKRTEQLAGQKTEVLLDARQREDAVLTQELPELKARETDRGIELTIGDVLFDVGQATLKPGATNALSRLAAFLREHTDRQVLIEGHTDSEGTPDYNLNLSLARADSVARALVAQGVDGARVSPRGFGESTPIASNDSAAGRLQNRRVEIVVVAAAEPVVHPRVGSAR